MAERYLVSISQSRIFSVQVLLSKRNSRTPIRFHLTIERIFGSSDDTAWKILSQTVPFPSRNREAFRVKSKRSIRASLMSTSFHLGIERLFGSSPEEYGIFNDIAFAFPSRNREDFCFKCSRLHGYLSQKWRSFHLGIEGLVFSSTSNTNP